MENQEGKTIFLCRHELSQADQNLDKSLKNSHEINSCFTWIIVL